MYKSRPPCILPDFLTPHGLWGFEQGNVVILWTSYARVWIFSTHATITRIGKNTRARIHLSIEWEEKPNFVVMFKIAVSSHESQHIPVSNGAKNTSFITIFQALLLEKQHPLYSKAEPERRVNLLCEK